MALLSLVAILAVGMSGAQTNPFLYVTLLIWNQTGVVGLATAWESPLQFMVQVEPVDS